MLFIRKCFVLFLAGTLPFGSMGTDFDALDLLDTEGIAAYAQVDATAAALVADYRAHLFEDPLATLNTELGTIMKLGYDKTEDAFWMEAIFDIEWRYKDLSDMLLQSPALSSHPDDDKMKHAGVHRYNLQPSGHKFVMLRLPGYRELYFPKVSYTRHPFLKIQTKSSSVVWFTQIEENVVLTQGVYTEMSITVFRGENNLCQRVGQENPYPAPNPFQISLKSTRDLEFDDFLGAECVGGKECVYNETDMWVGMRCQYVRVDGFFYVTISSDESLPVLSDEEKDEL